jgi:hypothetical protein
VVRFVLPSLQISVHWRAFFHLFAADLALLTNSESAKDQMYSVIAVNFTGERRTRQG